MGRLAASAGRRGRAVEALPASVARILDLGCGDGRLVSLVLDARPEVTEAIGLDNSPPMLELARQRFAEDDRVTIVEHDLGRPCRRSARSTSCSRDSRSTTCTTSASSRSSARSAICSDPVGSS